MGNPFADREPFKKRIITASLTAEQRDAFEKLKDRTHTVTDGAMIKKALEQMIDALERDDRLAEAAYSQSSDSETGGER